MISRHVRGAGEPKGQSQQHEGNWGPLGHEVQSPVWESKTRDKMNPLQPSPGRGGESDIHVRGRGRMEDSGLQLSWHSGFVSVEESGGSGRDRGPSARVQWECENKEQACIKPWPLRRNP